VILVKRFQSEGGPCSVYDAEGVLRFYSGSSVSPIRWSCSALTCVMTTSTDFSFQCM
jgi:hypothetical protein